MKRDNKNDTASDIEFESFILSKSRGTKHQKIDPFGISEEQSVASTLLPPYAEREGTTTVYRYNDVTGEIIFPDEHGYEFKLPQNALNPKVELKQCIDNTTKVTTSSVVNIKKQLQSMYIYNFASGRKPDFEHIIKQFDMCLTNAIRELYTYYPLPDTQYDIDLKKVKSARAKSFQFDKIPGFNSAKRFFLAKCENLNGADFCSDDFIYFCFTMNVFKFNGADVPPACHKLLRQTRAFCLKLYDLLSIRGHFIRSDTRNYNDKWTTGTPRKNILSTFYWLATREWVVENEVETLLKVKDTDRLQTILSENYYKRLFQGKELYKVQMPYYDSDVEEEEEENSKQTAMMLQHFETTSLSEKNDEYFQNTLCYNEDLKC